MFAAELVEAFGGDHLGDLAGGRGFREPLQESHHRRAVAGLGGALSGLFGGVLAGFGQHRGVAQLGHLRAG